MDGTGQDQDTPKSDTEEEVAVPYIPPPPPTQSSEKSFRSPAINGALIALVILIGGFMTYNYVGHSLTQLQAVSTEVPSTNYPSISPTISPSQ